MQLLNSEEIANLFLFVKKKSEKNSCAFWWRVLRAVIIDYLRYLFSIQMTNRCASSCDEPDRPVSE